MLGKHKDGVCGIFAPYQAKIILVIGCCTFAGCSTTGRVETTGELRACTVDELKGVIEDDPDDFFARSGTRVAEYLARTSLCRVDFNLPIEARNYFNSSVSIKNYQVSIDIDNSRDSPGCMIVEEVSTLDSAFSRCLEGSQFVKGSV